MTLEYHPTFIQATETAGDRLMALRVRRLRQALEHWGISRDQMRAQSDIMAGTLRPGEPQYVELYNSGFGKACIHAIRDRLTPWKQRNCLVVPRKGSDEQCHKSQDRIEYTPI
jgi:hypothetical protein